MQIGILGLGKVGSGVFELIAKNNDVIAKRIGEHIHVKRILVKDLSKKRSIPVEKNN